MDTLQAAYLQPLDRIMRDIVKRHLHDEPGFGVMIRYALGWEDNNGHPYQHPTGKRLRPLTTLLCAHAMSDNWEAALPAAAAVEILHNFSLIHDDIQDGSPLRHKRPTVWKVWGTPNAINAGDAMFTLAYAALTELTASLTPQQMIEVWKIFNKTNIELTRGQHLDMRFETQSAVTVEEYLSMITGKSAALIAASAQLGAFIATGEIETSKHFSDFGLNLGIAFQIHDDILGIWGEESVTGKSSATDIASRKKSLPVLFALSASPDLAAIYADPSYTDIANIIHLVSGTGARQFAQDQETLYYDRAMQSLYNAMPRQAMLPTIEGFVNFLLTRDH